MLKETIKYIDYDGTEKECTAYFSINKVDAIRLTAELGDIETYANQLVAKGDTQEQIAFIERMVLDSYAQKSDDGIRLVKTKQAREEFENSLAYAELLVKLLTDEDYLSKFVKNFVHDSTVNASKK